MNSCHHRFTIHTEDAFWYCSLYVHFSSSKQSSLEVSESYRHAYIRRAILSFFGKFPLPFSSRVGMGDFLSSPLSDDFRKQHHRSSFCGHASDAGSSSFLFALISGKKTFFLLSTDDFSLSSPAFDPVGHFRSSK